MSDDTIRSNQSRAIGNLAFSLSLVQAGLEPAGKDCYNPFHKSHYASLTSCWNACRGLLAANDLSVVQAGGGGAPLYEFHKLSVEATEKVPVHQVLGVRLQVEVVTTLIHSSGEWIRGSMSAMIDKGSGQDVVAAVTYLRRAGLCAIVGVSVAEDAAPGSRPRPTPQRAPAAVKTPHQHGPGRIVIAEPGETAQQAADREDAESEPTPKPEVASRDVHQLGIRLYGEDGWVSRRAKAAGDISNGRTSLINHLTPEEMGELIEELKRREKDGEL